MTHEPKLGLSKTRNGKTSNDDGVFQKHSQSNAKFTDYKNKMYRILQKLVACHGFVGDHWAMMYLRCRL